MPNHHRPRLEQQCAKVRHKIHRHDPAQHQRDHGHRKNRKGVFSRDGFGQADRQETDGGDQGAGQHRHGRDFIRKGGSSHFVVTLFHFPDHHFYRNDGVVDQQAEGDDQRAQRYFVQPDVPVIHGQKRHRQHQRNRDAHHQTGPHVDAITPPERQHGSICALVQTQADEADRQHDQHRLNQHAHKLVDGADHCFGLVLNLHQLDARGQAGIEAAAQLLE